VLQRLAPTPKYMSPMPMPAANSIAVHDRKLKSGFASSGPRRMSPKLLAATSARKTRNSVTAAL